MPDPADTTVQLLPLNQGTLLITSGREQILMSGGQSYDVRGGRVWVEALSLSLAQALSDVSQLGPSLATLHRQQRRDGEMLSLALIDLGDGRAFMKLRCGGIQDGVEIADGLLLTPGQPTVAATWDDDDVTGGATITTPDGTVLTYALD